jgi:hypothetical protein
MEATKTTKTEEEMQSLWNELQDQARELVEQGDIEAARKLFAEADKIHGHF